MYLITWKTYILRREIKSFWYKWDKDNNWWIWNNYPEKLHLFITKNNLLVKEVDNKELPELTKLDYDILYAKKRLEKWWIKQEKKENEANITRISEYEKQFLRLWEPIKIWHHSEKRHRKLIEKIDKDFQRRWEAYKEAEKAEDKKEYWEDKLKELEAKKAWTWLNAKQRKEKTIELIKTKIKVWDKIIYNREECIIEKINKNTIKVDKYSFNIDINFINFINLIKKQWKINY
jgi:hypothetical protein